jgi:translation initiation factor IF-2
MADVTVSALAATVGASVERLLTQMQEAGLPQQTADETVTDEEKQTLLVYLKGLHGEQAQAPKKITLKRKSISTLKAGGSGKSVNVEVRKKRVYVKRDPAVSTDEAIKPAATATPVAGSVQANLEDAETKRLNAIDARKREERIASLAAEEAAKSQKEKEEAVQSQKAQETVNTTAASEVAAPVDIEEAIAKQGKKRGKHDEDDEDRPKKKKLGKTSRKTKVDELIEDIDEDAGPSKPRLTSSGVVVKLSNKHVFEKPTKQAVYNVEIGETIVVADLARQMSLKAGVVIKVLMNMGVMATINDSIDQDTAMLAVEELGHTASVKKPEAEVVEDELRQALAIDGAIEKRAPVVTVMGHVDHGKTSLLDYIRESRVASGEAGGITQHIGAYHVDTSHGMITFLDTPGHAAFTAMRSRGAQSTDVVVLVVAADDGVMPQTEEAIQHSKAAGVPLIVAINKMDKEGADPERVTSELAAKDLVPEGWGGDTQFVNVSALTGEGIEELLEAILLQAELLELSAPVDAPAQGLIIEARLEKGRGVVATALIQAGTLRKGEFVLAGQSVGKIRAMNDESGAAVVEAGPSIPVEILGLDATPSAGDEFAVIQDERKARELAELRKQKSREEKVVRQQESQLENMFATFEGTGTKILPILIKADVRGSLEAILSALADFNTDEVAVKIISSGVGGLNESDINLAMNTNAVVLGFNVRAEATARRRAEEDGIEIRYYSVIYNLLDEIKQSLSGMLEPEVREKIVGIAEVRDVFKSPKFGQIAGCMIVEGTVFRDKPIRVLRDNVVIYQGELESLRRFKDDVSNVRSGVECGIGVKDYNDVKAGDQIEVYDIEHVAREL